MGVIVAEHAWAVELVNCDAPGFAEEELLDDAILHRNHRCPPRSHNIGSLMRLPSGPPLREGVSDIASVQALNRQGQLSPGEQLVVIARRHIIGSREARECVQKQGETNDRE